MSKNKLHQSLKLQKQCKKFPQKLRLTIFALKIQVGRKLADLFGTLLDVAVWLQQSGRLSVKQSPGAEL